MGERAYGIGTFNPGNGIPGGARGRTSIPADGMLSAAGAYSDGMRSHAQPEIANIATASLTSDLYDIEQITVLRGPQGTLFGRNTTAGALSISTRKPERTFNSKVEFSAGTTGSAVNNQNKVGARAQLYFQPGDAFDLRIIADFSHQQENGAQVLVDPGLTLANGSSRPNNIFVRTARFGYTPIFDPFARHANIDQRQAMQPRKVSAWQRQQRGARPWVLPA